MSHASNVIHYATPVGRFVLILVTLIESAWQRQTKDFGHGQNTNRDQSTKYSCLIFDNRGIGKSDKPLARYSTSEMAKDTLELIDHVGWTSERQLHVIGVSMGGMIAQELVSNHITLAHADNSYEESHCYAFGLFTDSEGFDDT